MRGQLLECPQIPRLTRTRTNHFDFYGLRGAVLHAPETFATRHHRPSACSLQLDVHRTGRLTLQAAAIDVDASALLHLWLEKVDQAKAANHSPQRA